MRKLLLVTALVGCTLAPHYERPPLPVQDRFPGGGGGRLTAADTGWRAMFTDPRLQALIALALANNRDLRVAVLNVEVARAQYRIQRAQLLPGVDGLGAVTHFTGGGFAPMTSSRGTGSSSANIFPPTLYALGVNASWELDLFGRVRSLTKAQLEAYLSSAEALRATHLSLVSQVVTQYLTERSLAEQYEVALHTEATTRQTYEL